jgi:hypothetical protein
MTKKSFSPTIIRHYLQRRVGTGGAQPPLRIAQFRLKLIWTPLETGSEWPPPPLQRFSGNATVCMLFAETTRKSTDRFGKESYVQRDYQ